jgi:hypothetical protein
VILAILTILADSLMFVIVASDAFYFWMGIFVAWQPTSMTILVSVGYFTEVVRLGEGLLLIVTVGILCTGPAMSMIWAGN